MKVDILRDEEKKTVKVSGRLDTITAPELEESLKGLYEDTKHLILDFSELDYISSAGLRVLLGAQKVMNKQGTMTVTNVIPAVMEVFEITGFSDILDIE